MVTNEQSVFFSYAWGLEREEIVNQIDQSLQARGIKVVRDKRDLGYRGSIRNFMEQIGKGDCVIVVISDKYLKSPNCMFELVEVAENKQFTDRIIPVILPDAKIYNPSDRLDYVKYWEDEKAKLDQKMRSLSDLSGLGGIREELDDYDRFRDEISNLTSILKDMNALTPDMHRASDFTEIYEAIKNRLDAALQNGTKSDRSDSNMQSTPQKEKQTMDPITLAAAAATILSPFIKKAGEAAAEKLGEKLPDTVGKIWGAITKKSSSATEAASDLAKNPDDADNEVVFKKQLQKAFEKDQELASMVAELLEKAKSEASISNVGDGAVATGGSTAVGKIEINGDLSGNLTIGNNNSVNSNK